MLVGEQGVVQIANLLFEWAGPGAASAGEDVWDDDLTEGPTVASDTLVLWMIHIHNLATKAMSRCLVAFGYLVGLVLAQGSETRLAIRRWGTDEGLPQNRISALAQTADGYLWVGTWFGLARFDGVRFTLFDRYNTPVLTNDAINALAGTPDGALYVGIRAGLVRQNQGAWQYVPRISGLSDHSIWALAVDGSGRLWLDTDGWAGPFPSGPFESVGQGRDIWRKIVPDGDQGVASVTAKHELVFLPDEARALPRTVLRWPTNAVTMGNPHAFEVDGDGGWWFGTDTGLWHWDARAASGKAWTNGWSGRRVDQLFRDRSGTLWIGARDSGLHRLGTSSVDKISLARSGREPDVTTLMEDRDGILWVGTDLGLFQVHERLINSVGPETVVMSVSEGPGGQVWAATRNGAMELRLPGVKRDLAIGPSAGRRCVIADRNGVIWMNEDHQPLGELLCVRLDNSRTRPDIGFREKVESLALDAEGRLWVGTDRGVLCLKDERPVALDHLPTGDVRAAYQTRDGAMWFGTNGQGLFRWRAGELVSFTRQQGLSDDRVFAFHEDADGILWIGTHNGLTRLEGGAGEKAGWRYMTLSRSQGLFDDLINHILEDDSGHLWFSCNRGLFRIARSELNAVAAGREVPTVTAVFGEADGMPDNETNGEHQPAGCKTRDGRLWFPTMRGVAVVDPARISTNEIPPQVLIEEVVVDDEVLLGGDPSRTSSRKRPGILGTNGIAPIHLEPGRAQTVRFGYTAPTFINARQVRFRHRLRGLSDVWRDAGTERVAYFNNLKPGDYTFEVIAANAHGAWQTVPATVDLSLSPRFTQTPWFPISLIVAGASVTAWLVSRRLHWVRRMAAAQQALHLEQERSRIAADLHDDLGSRLTALSLRGRGSGLEDDLRRLAERLRGLIWSVDPASDSLESLTEYLVDFAERLTAGGGMALSLELPTPMPSLRLGTQARHQLALVIQEALTNSVRHSGCQRLTFQVSLNPDCLVLGVVDDGNGAVTDRPAGRGLSTMRSRMQKLGGELIIQGRTGSGTRVEVRLPQAFPSQNPHVQPR